MPRRPQDPLARFYAKVNRDGPLPERHPEVGPCHLWTASTHSRGYGQFHADGTTVDAHSWLWRQLRGPLPPRHVLDHWACDRQACVNLDHCRPTTQRENILRSESAAAVNRAKERCREGHAYAGENLYEWRGTRRCRTCDRKRRAERYARERARSQ
jgi:hypothetical protein